MSGEVLGVRSGQAAAATGGAPLLTAAQAARQLGVKPQTLYAYVSRGLLRSERAEDGRASLFHAEEVQLLALRGRRGATTTATGPAIASALTLIDGNAHYYRGRAAAELARRHTFEEVAEWLWRADLPHHPTWRPAPAARARSRRVLAALPEPALPLDRFRVLAATLGALDDLRYDLRPDAVVVAARALLATLVEALPLLGPESLGLVLPDRPPLADTFAGRLWPRLSQASPSPEMLALLNSALVLLADHELTLSTLAARVAAACQADPYAVVSSGLGVVGGLLHDGAALAVEALLSEINQPEEAAAVIGARLRRGDRLPGFGLPLYPGGDPRAKLLLTLLAERATDRTRLARVLAVLRATEERGVPPPNVDFALAAFSFVAGFIRGGGEAIFALARCAGWVAHALEEYAQRSALRPRAIYIGATPPRVDR